MFIDNYCGNEDKLWKEALITCEKIVTEKITKKLTKQVIEQVTKQVTQDVTKNSINRMTQIIVLRENCHTKTPVLYDRR